jgi:hypothetical protein
MRTRKSKSLKGGIKYTNPTSSNLNLNLYSKQVGGTCKEKHEKYCKKSCKKLCRYVKTLPKKDYLDEIKSKTAVLQSTVEALKTEHKKLADAGKARYDSYRPSYYKGGFFFEEKDNTACIDNCNKICVKGTKEICEKTFETVYPLEENLKIEALLAQKKYLESEISNMKLNQGIYN